MNEKIIEAAAWILPLIFAIVFHEVSHGLMARALGDPTAEEQKRLSLNPFRHVDPIGTVVVPGFLALAHLPVFGWAKPVPVNGNRLRNPRRDMMLVAAAGPGSNLIMALIAALVLGLVLRPYAGMQQPGGVMAFAALNLFNFILINVFLALFNLLPVPPFDGGHIIEGLLPAGLAARYGELHKYALLVMILLIVVLPMISPSLNVIGWVVSPAVDWLTGHYLELARAVAGL